MLYWLVVSTHLKKLGVKITKHLKPPPSYLYPIQGLYYTRQKDSHHGTGWDEMTILNISIVDRPWAYMDVSESSGTPKSSILIGFSIIFTIHFGVPLFLETPISNQPNNPSKKHGEDCFCMNPPKIS